MKQNTSQFQTLDRQQQRFTAWFLFIVLFSATLIISFEVHDSALLKPSVLFIGVALLLAYYFWVSLKNASFEFSVTHVHIFFTFYLLASFISLTQAINVQRGIHEVALQVSYYIIFVFAFSSGGGIERQRFFQNGILMMAISVACVGLIEALSPTAFDLIDINSDRPVFSTFGNATFFAGFIVMLVPLILSQILTSEKSSLKQAMLSILILVMLSLLILTETRSSWVAMTVTIVLFIFLQFKSMKIRWLMVGGLIAAALIGAAMFPSIIQRRLGEISQLTIPSTLKERFVFYDAAWKGFLSSPLFGHGVGGTVVSIPFFRTPDYWMTGAEDIVTHIHNEYLEVLFETGIVGFLPWCAVLVVCILTLKKSISSSMGPERTVLVGYVSAIVGFLVDNLTSMNFRVPADALFFWFLVGISLSQAQLSSKKFSFRLPMKLKSLRWVSVVGMGVFLYLYVPQIQNLYAGDKNFNKGLLLNKNNDRSSRKYFKDAIKSDPSHEQARFFLSLNLVQEKSFAEARKHLDTLLAQFPAYPKARLLLALSLYDLGDTAQAFFEAEKDLRLATYPQSYHYMCVLAYRSHLSDLEYRYTKIRLRKSIESKTTDYTEEALTRLSYLCPERGELDTCRSLILQSTQVFKNRQTLLLTASEALVKLKYINDAQNVLKVVEPDVMKDSTLQRRYSTLLTTINSGLK